MSIFLIPLIVQPPEVDAVLTWLPGWNYRKSHVIEHEAGAGTNYAVNVTVFQAGGTVYSPTFTEDPTNPISTTYPGSPEIVKLGSDYHIFYVSNGASGRHINHANTTDLTDAWASWTQDPDNTVLDAGSPGAWDDYGACWGSSVLYDIETGLALQVDGKYWMFYPGYADASADVKIGIATNTDLYGDWTKDYDNSPCLEPSASGWDSKALASTGSLTVFKDSDGVYKMLYAGCASLGWYDQIGLATSNNLIDWTKHGSNPIITYGPADSWEERGIYDMAVWKNDTTYIVIYTGQNDETLEKMGLATGTSIEVLTKNLANPIMYGQQTWDSKGISDFAIIYTDKYYIFYEGENATPASEKLGRMWTDNILQLGSQSGSSVGCENHCNDDFSDIRFTDNDGVTLLDYWMETKVDSQYAVFWVEVADDLSTVDQTIYLYYGNSEATTTSNDANTFLTGCDFNDGSTTGLTINTAGSGTAVVETGVLHAKSTVVADGWVVGIDLDGIDNFFWETVIEDTTDSTDGGATSCYYGLFDNASVPTPMLVADWNAQNRFRIVRYNHEASEDRESEFCVNYVKTDDSSLYWDGDSWETYNSATSCFGGSGVFKVRIWDDGTNYKADILDSDGVTIFASVPTIAKATVKAFSAGRVALFAEGLTDYHYLGMEYDNLMLRMYVDPEPVHGAWGSEETYTTPPYYFTFHGIYDEDTGELFNASIRAVNVTAYWSDGTNTEVFEVNGTYYFGSDTKPLYFSFDTSSTREYWVGSVETTGDIYIFDAGPLTTYTISFVDLTNILDEYSWVLARRYVNGTLHTIEKRKADAEKKIVMNLIPNTKYSIRIEDGVSYDYGDVLFTTDTSKQLVLTGLEFPSTVTEGYKYLRVWAYRDYESPTDITVNYQDLVELTSNVSIAYYFINDTLAYETWSSHDTFISTWTGADVNTTYYVIVDIDRTSGSQEYRQVFGRAFSSNPWGIDLLWPSAPFNTDILIPAFIIICVGGVFSALNVRVGALATVATAIVLIAIWGLPVAPELIVLAVILVIMLAIVKGRETVIIR